MEKESDGGSVGDLDETVFVMQVEERLFGQTIESLDTHIARLQAIADKERYCLLYLLYQQESMERSELKQYPGISADELDEQLQPLLNTSLVTKVPGPSGTESPHTTYRITTLGRHQIEDDISRITGSESLAEDGWEG